MSAVLIMAAWFYSAEKDMLFTQCMDAGTYKTTKIASIGCPFKNTAVICQNVLYWLSPDGVYAYTGGIPQRISDKLPDISNAQKACAGTDGLRYYLDVQDGGRPWRVVCILSAERHLDSGG